MRAIRIDGNRRLLERRGLRFPVPVLRIPREIRKKSRRNLHPDAMTLQEYIAGDEVIQLQFVDLMRFEQLPTRLELTVTGAQDIEARTHKVESGAVGSHIEHAYIQIRIPAVAAHVDIGRNRTRDFQIPIQWSAIESENVRALCQLPVVVRSRGIIRVRDRIGGIRNERADSVLA